jgi:hypothetical protein
MKANRFVTFAIAIVTVLLIGGGVASQVLIVAEALGTRVMPQVDPVIQEAMAGRDAPGQTGARIMVAACRDHTPLQR